MRVQEFSLLGSVRRRVARERHFPRRGFALK